MTGFFKILSYIFSGDKYSHDDGSSGDDCGCSVDGDIELQLTAKVEEFFDTVSFWNFYSAKSELLSELSEILDGVPELAEEKQGFLDAVDTELCSKFEVLCNGGSVEADIIDLICDLTDDLDGPGDDDSPCPTGDPAGTTRISGTADSEVISADFDIASTIAGNDGDDTINGSGYNDFLLGNRDEDVLNGGCGNDTLYGGSEDDELYGDAGDDMLYGDSEDDFLDGGAGNDRVNGGRGSDQLSGGEGDDTFVFTVNTQDDDAVDTILDFEAGSDAIEFQSFASDSAFTTVQAGADTEIYIDGTLEIVVLQSSMAEVSDAFVFNVA
ncbi:hypothetical protein [Alloyangia pacifica]|uniref:hypothetical protein n=1 Tax=Alloyangia pacifica TaxID=311180 RepID=UPI001CD6F749|nr:hypothetical protein [Alloyangia pacifica]MCA0994788.1 hypothetical protein [Alloyangia pacifica]